MGYIAIENSYLAESNRNGRARTQGWNPLRLNPFGFWRADRGITLTSSKVSQWDDLSGQGWYMQQTTSGRRPVMTTAAGHDAIAFTASNSNVLSTFEDRDGGSTDGPRSYWGIFKVTDLVSDGFLCEINNENGIYQRPITGLSYNLHDGAVHDCTDPIGQPYIAVLVVSKKDSDGHSIAYKFSQGAWVNIGYHDISLSGVFTGTCAIGADFDPVTAHDFTRFSDVTCLEFGVTCHELTLQEQNNLATYISARYGATNMDYPLPLIAMSPSGYWVGDFGTTSAPGGVSHMTDLSGTGWDMVQSNSSIRPDYQGVGARFTVFCQPANGEYITTIDARAFAGNGTLLTVFMLDTANNQGVYCSRVDTQLEHRQGNSDGHMNWRIGSSTVTDSVNTAFVLEAMLTVYPPNGGTATAYKMVSGAWSSVGTATIDFTDNGAQKISIGGRSDGSQLSKAYIYEVCYWNRQLNSTERSTVASYLASRYSL